MERAIGGFAAGVNVGIGVDAALGGAKAGDVARAIVERATRGCDRLLAELGLAARSRVEVASSREAWAGDGIVSLRVSGSRCPIPVDARSSSYFGVRNEIEQHLDAERLNRFLTGRGDVAPEAIADWVVRCVLESIRRNAGLLVSREVAAATAAQALTTRGKSASGVTDDAFHLILTRLAASRIAATKTDGLELLLGAAAAPEEIAEHLATAVRPGAIEILIDPAYFRQIVLEEQDRNVLADVRARLRRAPGLMLPQLKFVPSDAVGADSFAFRINDVAGMPRRGIAPGLRLVRNAAVESDAPAALDPATGEEGRLARASSGLSPLGYLAASMEAEVRRNAACLVSFHDAERELEALRPECPSLVAEFEQRHGGALALTALFRNLVAEGVSIRNVRGILDAAVMMDMVKVDPRLMLFDGRLPSPDVPDEAALRDCDNISSFVRIRMRRAITMAARSAMGFVGVHLLAPEIEDAILVEARAYRESPASARGPFIDWVAGRRGDAFARDLVRQVRKTIGRQLTDRSPNVILTTAVVRPWFRKVIAGELPLVSVIAYEELLPDTDLTPMSRIASGEPLLRPA